MIGAGVLSGLISAAFGLADWLKASSGLGAWREAGHLTALTLFAVSWYLRTEEPASPSNAAMTLSCAGAAVLLTVYWLATDESELEAPELSGNVPAA